MAALLRPVTISTSGSPARAASSTMYCSAGRSTTGSSSFGTALVAGRNRVPMPATGMTAFRADRAGWSAVGMPGSLASLRSVLPDPEAVAAKAELRLRLLTRRTERSDTDRAAAADAVTRALLAELTGAGTVAAFVPDPIEPGAGRLPAALAELDARLLLPVVPDTGRELRWAEHTGPLAPGRFGLMEPV